MRTIITSCKIEGESLVTSVAPNLFRLDIHELCDLTGMKPLTENIDRVVVQLGN
jgi:hypothetical protein